MAGTAEVQLGRGERTRAAMLDAGLRRVGEATMDDLLSFLSPEQIARSAGRSKSTFFHHWPTLSAYVDDLVTAAAGPSREPSPVVGAALAALGPDEEMSSAWIGRLRRAAMAALDAMEHDPRLPMLYLAPVSADPDVREMLRLHYRSLDALIAGVGTGRLATSALTLREPFTPETLAATIHAFSLGFALRARVEPDRATAVLYADVLTSLLPAVLANPERDNLPLDEFIDQAMLDAAREADEGSRFAPLDPTPARLRAARDATVALRTEVVPLLEADLDAALEHPSVDSRTIAHDYFRRLYELADEHKASALATLGAVAASLLAAGSPRVPDPLAESGLDALTRRTLLPLVPWGTGVEDLARSTNLGMLRCAVGLEPLAIDDYIATMLGSTSVTAPGAPRRESR